MKLAWWAAGLAAVVWVGASTRDRVAQPLMMAMKATGAAPAGYSLNGWVELPAAASRTPLDRLLGELSAATRIAGETVSTSGPNFRKVSVTRTVAHIRTQLIVERLSSGRTFLVIDRVSAQGVYGLDESDWLIRQTLAHWGTVHLAMTLQGWIRPAITRGAYPRVVGEALAAVSARRVNGIATRRYVSVAGDTPLISQHDMLAGHPVDIQVAVTANPYAGATEVDIGSPLVTVTY